MGHPGYIVRIGAGGEITGYPATYKTQTVFACSPLLPVIVAEGDASLGYTALRQMCQCGGNGNGNGSLYRGVVEDDDDNDAYTRWSQLHFERREGVSFVNAISCGATFVAGRDAAWIPSLVPAAYQNNSPSAEPSRGLAGDLPIILALMGFHGQPGRASDVFFDQKWLRGRWRGSSRASAYRTLTMLPLPLGSAGRTDTRLVPRVGENPRGLLAQLCADNLVPGMEDSEEFQQACLAAIRDLEYSTILVEG